MFTESVMLNLDRRKFFMITVLAAALAVAGTSAFAKTSAEELVIDTTDRMLAKLKEQKDELERHPEKVYDLVNAIVLPHFDFPRMAMRVLGRYWRTATPDQRRRFTEEFRTLLVRTYANSLTKYTDQKITYLPVRSPAGADDVSVTAEVDRPGASPVEISYQLFDQGDAWKVYDVKIEGASLVTNYRSTFSTEIRNKGLDALIDTLAQRNREGTEPK
jgi:phospholipid transport system substrate-binding protein